MIYSQFVNLYKNQTIIIAGCGPSVIDFQFPNNIKIMGLNDFNRYHTSDFLVCVNEPQTFLGDRWDFIKNTSANFVFSQIENLPINDSNKLIHIRLGDYRGTDQECGKINYIRDSSYMALNIAIQLGFTKIGLIGIDFLGHHNLSKNLDITNETYRELLSKNSNISVYNLSNISLLNSIPFINLETFLEK